LSPAALDLAEWLLAYDPQSRATASQALGAPYFTSEEPAPELPTWYVGSLTSAFPALTSCSISQLEGEWHELETKRERAKKRRKTDGAPGSQA
jgi:CTD kinase subunit alpha